MAEQPQVKRIPKTKDELIKMLKERLESAETTITEMQEVLESERDKREKLSQQLQQKETRITELIETESKTLQDKVQQSLFNTLESANKSRSQAVDELKNLQADNQTLNQEIHSLDNRLLDLNLQINQRKKKLSILESKKTDLKLKEQAQVKKEKELRAQRDKVQRQTERITKDYNQLNEMIENMKNIRNYLNVTLQHQPRKIDSQKENRQKQKASINQEDNFWNIQP